MTITKEFDQRVDKAERGITNRYTQGTYRVKVSTHWYPNSKAYISTVSECKIQATDNPNFSFEISTGGMFGGEDGDFSARILTQKSDRYNFKTLEALHTQAIEEASGTIMELLIKGETDTEIRENA